MTIAVQAQTDENLADECLHFNSLSVEPEPVVDMGDSTGCASRSSTDDCWAGVGTITQLRVVATGGWDDAREGVDYRVVLFNGVDVWRGFSYNTNCEPECLVLRAAASRREVSQEDMILRAEVQLLRDELEEQRGAVLRAMMLAGASAQVARAVGYHLHELEAAGFVNGLKATQYTCTEVMAAGYSTSGRASGFWS